MKKTYEIKVEKEAISVDVISEQSGLSKSLVKKLMTFGCVWQKSEGKKKEVRLRSHKRPLPKGTNITVYYDPKIIESKIDKEPIELFSSKAFGVWYKPQNWLSGGTLYGDKFSVLRFAEVKTGNKSFLVNRLDKEVSGLIVIAYSSKAAGELSKIWSTPQIKKYYRALILGELDKKLPYEIDFEIDGKESKTIIHDAKVIDGNTLVKLEILTGRKHQIRVHMEDIGYPIIGDPKYGEGNKNDSGIKLQACEISLPSAKGKNITVELSKDLYEF